MIFIMDMTERMRVVERIQAGRSFIPFAPRVYL